MAIYSLSADVFSRSKGHRATAAAAYRAGVEIHDQTIGERFDYSRKRGIVHSEILAPENAPAWMHDRSALWNAVEAQETRINSQLAREVMVALPHELDEAERLKLVRGFVQREFVDAGMVADFSIHEPSHQGDERNYHAHIMLTLRAIDGDGFARKKAREWNSDERLRHWREAWAQSCNTALEEAGYDARIDHRSLAEQGIDREPTEHMGKAATAAERKGETTDRGERNREAQEANREIDDLVEELAVIDAEIAAAEERRLDALYGPDNGLAADAQSELVPTDMGGGAVPLSQEQKRTDRRAFDLDPDMDPAPADAEPDRPLSPEEKRQARDAIADGEAMDRDAGHGEVRHGGLGMPWWQYAAVYLTRIGEHIMEHVVEPAVEAAQDAWQRFVHDERDHIGRDRDDGPTMER